MEGESPWQLCLCKNILLSGAQLSPSITCRAWEVNDKGCQVFVWKFSILLPSSPTHSALFLHLSLYRMESRSGRGADGLKHFLCGWRTDERGEKLFPKGTKSQLRRALITSSENFFSLLTWGRKCFQGDTRAVLRGKAKFTKSALKIQQRKAWMGLRGRIDNSQDDHYGGSRMLTWYFRQHERASTSSIVVPIKNLLAPLVHHPK